MRRAAFLLLVMAVAALPGHASAQAAPGPSIEQRVKRAEDVLAIRRVLIDYAWALDTRDADAYAALFDRDGEWVNGTMVRKGHEEIRQLVVGLFGTPQPGFVNRQSLTLTTNIAVDVDGDRAKARSRHLLVRRGPDGRPEPTLAGRYEDELIREDGTWKILRRIDYPVMPTPEEWRAIMRARNPAQ
ncbi:MAG: nuclear transport factor 2 family protein [Sphingomonas sp.]